MFNFRKFIALTFSALMLGACKAEFSVDTFVSDMFAAEEIDTPAIMKVEIPSCSEQSEYEGKILALFNTDSQASLTGCQNEGMTSFLVVSLFANVTSDSSSRDLVIFRVKTDPVEHEGKSYEVMAAHPAINSDFLKRVDSLMQENFQTLSYENILFSITLNNDDRGTALVTTGWAWIDGEPYSTYRRQPIKRRQKVEIKYSNLMSDLILQDKKPNALYVYREQK